MKKFTRWFIRSFGLKGSFLWAIHEMENGGILTYFPSNCRFKCKGHRFFMKHGFDDFYNGVETVQSAEQWSIAIFNSSSIHCNYWEKYDNNKHGEHCTTGDITII